MRVSSITAQVIILSVLAAVVSGVSVQRSTVRRSMRHYAGVLPQGYNVALFLQICQICGQFYGMDQSSSCVHDKTFRTFAMCLSSVENR